MKLVWNESQKILRKGRATLLFRTRLPLFAGVAEPIQTCYERAVKGLEIYAIDTLLPRMEKRLSESPRRNRLHASMPSLLLLCDGEMVDDRWVSLTLTLQSEEDGVTNIQKDYRVWDVTTGQLCPLEFFLSRKEARKYRRWTFFLRGDAVGGISGKKGGNNPIPNPEMALKMKKLPMRY